MLFEIKSEFVQTFNIKILYDSIIMISIRVFNFFFFDNSILEVTSILILNNILYNNL